PAYENCPWLQAVETIGELLKHGQPARLMMATSCDVRDIAARLNVRSNMGIITDATDLKFEGETLQVTVPWGGENVVTATLPQQGTGIVLTRPKAFRLEQYEVRSAEVETLNTSLNADSQKIKIVDRVELPSEGPALEEAAIIVSGGRGLGKAENFHLVEELAAALGGAAGATRAIVDAGWLPYSYQI